MHLSLTEKQFLKAYFMYVRLCGVDKRGRKKLFDVLKDVYCVDNPSMTAVFNSTESEHLRAADNMEKYSRIRRLLEFSRLNGREDPLSAEEKELLEIKADGMRWAIDKNLVHDEIPPGRLSVLDGLKTQLKNENVHALNALGLFYLTGVACDKDTETGMWIIKKSAKWNNLEGLLLALKFDPNNRDYYLPRLYTVCYQVAEEELWEMAEKKYGIKNKDYWCDITYLLEKLFNADQSYNRDKYVSTHSRILNTTLLSYEDKKRVLFSKNKDVVSRISDLPLKDDLKKERKIDVKNIEADVQDKKLRDYLLRVLSPETDGSKVFPLIIGESATLKTAKAALLNALKTFSVEVINAQYLTEQELHKTADNIFITRLTYNKDVNTVFIIENLDKLAGNAAAEVGEFLDPGYRKIRITSLNVTLNLSGCKFIGLAGVLPLWINFPTVVFEKQKIKTLGFGGKTDESNE